LAQADEELSSLELVLRLLDLAMRSRQAADMELVDVLFQPIDKEYVWSSFSEYRKFVDLGRDYMTADRVAAFENVLMQKCAANVGRDRSISRRIFASARLRRFTVRR
jgi:hypothetical protein